MARDITLPIKGGWIMVRMVPPTQIKPVFLGLYFAKPEKIFEDGAFEGGFVPSGLSERELNLLYRSRAKAKMSVDEREALVLANARLSGKLKRVGKRDFGYSAPAFTFLDEDEEGDDVPDQATELLREIDLVMRVRILTPNGEVCLEPHEYTIVPDMEPYIDCIGEEYQMRELGGLEKAKKLKEQLFYVMSRGIPKVEGYKMLLGSIERPNVFWLEPREEVQDYFRRRA